MAVILLTAAALFQQSLNAQDPPKIGLVLSGGGAKGLAHIGILKSLEEAGITPDFITGTSMGSIIGGLYAVGYSADEIKEIALSADWDQLLTNKTPLNEVAYEEKDYYNRYIYELTMSGLKLELPKGLIEGQKLSMLLSNLTRPVYDIDDFSKLPIPYACIGADIETGEKVVLHEGSLARSMRASMAIPTVFTPVEIDGRLLVDGGLVHNFPVEENIEMGADYIIGVFVGTHLMKREEMGSPLSVLTQSAFIHSSFDTEEQLKLVDLYIEPDIYSYGAGSFKDAEEIIKIGEKFGAMYLEQFRHLKDSLENKGWVDHPVTRPQVSDSIYITGIDVRNNNIVPESFILDRLDIEENRTITIPELEAGINNLYGTQYFTKILYDIRNTGNGQKLIIDVGEAPEASLKVALHYDMDTETSLLLNLTYRNLLLNNSRIVAEGEISQSPLLDVNYLKYFGERQKQSILLGYYLRNVGLPIIEEGRTSALYESNINRFYAGIQSSTRTNRLLQLIYAYETAVLRPDVVSQADYFFEKISFGSHSLQLNFEYNNLDDRYFPTRGMLHRINLKYTAATDIKLRFFLADTLDPVSSTVESPASIAPSYSHQWVIPLGEHLQFGFKNAFFFNIKDNTDSTMLSSGFLDVNFIGGFRQLMPNFRPFWGAAPAEYGAENLFYNELMFQYRAGRNLFFQLKSQFYHPYLPFGWIFPSMKDSEYDFGGKDYLLGAGLSAGYRSPIGPLSIAVGKDLQGGGFNYFISLGFYFNRN